MGLMLKDTEVSSMQEIGCSCLSGGSDLGPGLDLARPGNCLLEHSGLGSDSQCLRLCLFEILALLSEKTCLLLFLLLSFSLLDF